MALTENVFVGLGLDAHRLQEGLPFVIGGLRVPADKGMVAHSDGDVLLHAILDALLSAGDLPDLGTLFPDTEAVNKGRSSLDMAREVNRRLSVAGARILSIDSVVVCNRPRIAPLRGQLRESIAAVFDIPVSKVNVKGKTYEGMGPLGRGEGIEASAVVLVERAPES